MKLLKYLFHGFQLDTAHLIAILLMAVFTVLFPACKSSSDNQKTKDNLLEAYHAESNISKKYADFADNAEAEGLYDFMLMFKALSRSEEIHASNHRAALASLGMTVSGPESRQYIKGTLEENLQRSMAGELWEVDTMYAGFIQVANQEKQSYAVEVFTWARDTESKHALQLLRALEVVQGNGVTSMPAAWWVCPKCGNTFSYGTEEDPCPFCETPSEEFEWFGNSDLDRLLSQKPLQ